MGILLFAIVIIAMVIFYLKFTNVLTGVSAGLFVLIGLPVVLVLYVIYAYNKLVAQKNQLDNGFKQIDVQLKRRYDLIPNLVETVKDSMAYEQETLTMVINARNKAVAASSPNESIAANSELSGALGKLFAVMEAYPTLKAQDNVAKLMEELTTTENQIGFARQFYNDTAMGYNNAILMFPSNIIANMFKFKVAQYFEVTNPIERENVKVNLR